MISHSPEGSWVGKFEEEARGVGCSEKEQKKREKFKKKNQEKHKEEKARYEQFVNHLNTAFGHEVCSLDYKTKRMGYEGDDVTIFYQRHITLNINISSIIGPAAASNVEPSSLMSAISNSAQSQTQIENNVVPSSTTANQPEQPEQKTGTTLNPT